MTPQQLKAKLDEAIAIISDMEPLLEDPHTAANSWDAVFLKDRVFDFMDRHRDALREGGAA